MSATKRLCAAVLALLLTVLAAPPSASAAPPVFTHPGVLVSRPQLDFIRTQVNANAQPWRNAHNQMAGSQRAVVECGPFSNPNLGCTDERQDAIAAYAPIRDHTNSNAPLQTAWSAASWTRAAEIIRYTYSSWPNAPRFATMLRGVYLPEIVNGAATMNGNWELVMMESTLGIAVFLEDRTTYNRAVAKFRTRVPAFVYLPSDGALPKAPPGSG